MARNPDVNRLIAADFEASKLGKREVARRVFGDAERYGEVGRWIDGKVTPGPSVAVALAHALEQPETRYLTGTPLAAFARELAEANRLVASLDDRLQALEAKVAELPTTRDLAEGLHLMTEAIAAVASPDTRAVPQARPAKSARSSR